MVSVIVPIYNAQEYLDECIQSIINQSCHELEIILIDDGSTDKSQQICEKYYAEDSRVIYVRKQNGGVSSSRNIGLDLARGEYVVFVDADDYLEKEVIQHVENIMKKEASELVIWNATEVYKQKLKQCRPISTWPGNREEIYASLISNYYDKFYMGDYIRAVWGKMFCLDVIKNNNIKFDEQLYIGEDALFLIQYISHISKINNFNYYGYYYRILSSSAVRRYKQDLLQQSIIQMNTYKKIFGDDIDSPLIESSVCVFAWNTLNSLINNEKSDIMNALASIEYKMSDAYQWFEIINNNNFKCHIKPKWASKLVRIQIGLGDRISFKTNKLIVVLYEKLKRCGKLL